MTAEIPRPRDISQDKTALFELLYHTKAWIEKHGYCPMDAKFALLWVYGIIERASDERLGAIFGRLEEQQQTLQHRVEALEDRQS